MDSAKGEPKTSQVPPCAAPAFPEWLGRYQIQTLLGQGGAGYVLRALDPLLDRTVAIKVLNSRLASHPCARQQFLKEARAAARLRDDHIVPIYTVEEEAGVTYMVMEYVPGGTLADRLRAPRSLRGEEILSIARQVTRGLAAAHACGFVHGDIKPSNLLLEPAAQIALDDTGASAGDWFRVKIADFGLVQIMTEARAADEGKIAGTPGYMAPEQITGNPVDYRTDLYSLGALLYHMVTGRPPFVALTRDELLNLQLAAKPPRPTEVAPGLSLGALEDLILELLEREPSARPATAADVLRRLESLAGETFLSAEERARLAALRRFRVLDTTPDSALDDLTYIASYICGTPIALISLIDEDRQWIKAKVGLEVQQTARNISFCTHTIRQTNPLVISDALLDRRFADNPLVRSDPNIRFYAGFPLLTTDGHALGSLCVIDRVVREPSPEQMSALAAISRLVQEHLELRRALQEIQVQPAAAGVDDLPTCFSGSSKDKGEAPSCGSKTERVGRHEP